MLFWRVPTTATSHRLGGRMNAYHHGRHMRSVRSFQVCRLNKHHMVSVAVGLGVITLLLVIFAYHGGHGVGSWFYSLLIVLSGLAFVVFGPLLLCRFLMHAYYRQLEARSARLRATAQTQTGEAMVLPTAPHVYACIIIAQDEQCATSRLADLPTYDEAVSQFIPVKPSGRFEKIKEKALDSSTPKKVDTHRELHSPPSSQAMAVTTSVQSGLFLDDNEDCLPSYGEALAMIQNRSVIDLVVADVSQSNDADLQTVVYVDDARNSDDLK